MPEPVFVALIMADRVITEDNGKKGIIGTFTQFHARQFPALFPPWFLYAAVTNLRGDHAFSITVASDETQQVVFTVNGQFGVDDPRKVVELVVPVLHAPFPRAGTYAVIFQVDGEQIGSRLLEVAAMPAAPAGEQQS